MLAHRRWESLDRASRDWLRARYHFSVDAAGNPAHRALGSLIVWNDDEIAAGGGFPLHGHHDMEIVTYVRRGVLRHEDTLGSAGTLRAGDIQVLSAGRGIRHAEFNQGQEPLRLYQIWLLPRQTGGEPRWGSRSFAGHARCGGFAVLASGYGEDRGALPIRANARLLGARLRSGERVRQPLFALPHAYLVVASGRIEIDGEPMGPLDGVAISDATVLDISAFEDAGLVLVEAG